MIDIPKSDTCGLNHEERVEIIAKTLLSGSYVTTTINQYGGGHIELVTYNDGEEKSWYSTTHMSEKCDDMRYGHERLFVPTRSEVMEAIEMFKEKGWHAYRDIETDEYKVCREKYSRGEYADSKTVWIF